METMVISIFSMMTMLIFASAKPLPLEVSSLQRSISKFRARLCAAFGKLTSPRRRLRCRIGTMAILKMIVNSRTLTNGIDIWVGGNYFVFSIDLGYSDTMCCFYLFKTIKTF